MAIQQAALESSAATLPTAAPVTGTSMLTGLGLLVAPATSTIPTDSTLTKADNKRLTALLNKPKATPLTVAQVDDLVDLLTELRVIPGPGPGPEPGPAPGPATTPKITPTTTPLTTLKGIPEPGETPGPRPVTTLKGGKSVRLDSVTTPQVSGQAKISTAIPVGPGPFMDSPKGRTVPPGEGLGGGPSKPPPPGKPPSEPPPGPKPPLRPRFTLPNGKQLKAGEYPDTVDWKQGFTGITYTLSTGKIRYRRVKESGEPEATFRVLTMHKDAPEPRIVPLGAFNVVVKRKGLTFVRTKRKTLDKSKAKNTAGLKNIEGLTPSSTEFPTVDEVFAEMETTSRRQRVGSTQYVNRRRVTRRGLG